MVGLAALVHVFVVRGFIAPGPDAVVGLAWPLFGVLPFWIFGMWLLTATSSRMAVYLALGATGSAVLSSFETLMATSPELSESSGYALLNQVGLVGSAIGSVCGLLVLAAFPNGTTEHHWQQIALRLLWVTFLAVPLTLPTNPYVVPPDYTGVSATIPNPYAVPSLSWADPVVTELASGPWIPLAVAVGVFCSRILLGGSGLRTMLKPMGWTVGALVVLAPLWVAIPARFLCTTRYREQWHCESPCVAVVPVAIRCKTQGPGPARGETPSRETGVSDRRTSGSGSRWRGGPAPWHGPGSAARWGRCA